MLEAPIQPSTYSLRTKSKTSMSDDDGDFNDSSKARAKSRRELPTGAVETLKAWLLSPEHFTHPYPTPQDQALLMEKTGIDKKQLKNWFTNARRRIWKPMLKKQIEQGKLTAPDIGNAQSIENPHSVQAMRVHYQQAFQDQQEGTAAGAATAMVDAYTNATSSTDSVDTQPRPSQYYDPTKVQNSSINTLAQVSSSAQLNKTDSHAVLMELFARDQDLVRQATESARLKAEQKQQQLQQQLQTASSATAAPAPASQHPMLKAPSASVLHNVPTLNSWPHFSSITSLNNLGTLPGVKSITSLSGQDLVSKGNGFKMGSLAQVKSMESMGMGKSDSYAFLEVFFGDRSSTNLNSLGGARGSGRHHHHQQAEEDNEIGLSLDDETPSGPPPASAPMCPPASSSGPEKREPMHQPLAPPPSMPTVETEPGTLKRAYDDALAAKGLLSVSRSCETLTDLPAKMQRTLSQEFFNKRSQSNLTHVISNQYSSHEAKEPSQGKPPDPKLDYIPQPITSEDHVQVSCSTICAFCSQPNIDTQLRPCGHMFHERCLKPSLTNPIGPPKCPLCAIPIHSAVLAVPGTVD